jgi:hypothetical protein
VKLAYLRRPEVACSPSCANCIPKTNVAILLETGHTKGRDRAREGNEKLECG